MPNAPHDRPIAATAEGGEVLLDGPGALATSLTPAAARRSARHLRRAADDADPNRRQKTV